LSMREFLFGNGLYLYRDWTWPLSTSLTPVANFSPDILRNSGPDPMGFARMFLTWPIVLIDHLTSDVILAEKVYLLYFFSLFICLFFIFAELLVRLLRRTSGIVISQRKREFLVLSVVLLCFINFWSLAQLSDFYYTYMIEFGLIGIALLVVITETG